MHIITCLQASFQWHAWLEQALLALSMQAYTHVYFPTFCLYIYLRAPPWFYVEITEFEADGYAQTTVAMLQRPFCYRRSFMYMAVSDISYIAESVVLGEGKRLGGVNMGLKYPVSMR